VLAKHLRRFSFDRGDLGARAQRLLDQVVLDL
jgi:hypothetical protein